MMSSGVIDILMITYNRPHYTRLSLARLLDTCDTEMRVWIWHNGQDRRTLDVVRSMLDHPRVHAFHQSPDNRGLTDPTNWLWANSTGTYLSKVDDDCLVPDRWAAALRAAHADVPEFGVIGCWHFQEEDFVPRLARKKIESFRGGHRLLRNSWVSGSGYLMKRTCVENHGFLKPSETFPRFCIRLAWEGWVHGWHYPFVRMDHMDDPRSPNSGLRSDSDLVAYMPLTAARNGVSTLAEWQAMIRGAARHVQTSPSEPCRFFALRRWLYRLRRSVKHV